VLIPFHLIGEGLLFTRLVRHKTLTTISFDSCDIKKTVKTYKPIFR